MTGAERKPSVVIRSARWCTVPRIRRFNSGADAYVYLAHNLGEKVNKTNKFFQGEIFTR